MDATATLDRALPRRHHTHDASDTECVLPYLHDVAALAGKLVVLPNARPALVEQYRKLAATLHFAQTERAVKTLMVASSVAGEGKTFTASNLALTLSHSFKRRVLVIDGDLRRPSLHTVFQLPNVYGLTNELRSDGDRMPPTIAVTPTLSVMTAGRPDSDPMGALTSDRMRRIMDQAAATYEWVIVDTPPVGLLSDAKLLAAMVDAAILVIAAGATPLELIKRATETLGRQHIMGVILNRVTDRTESGGYNYYGYYGAYGGYAKRG